MIHHWNGPLEYHLNFWWGRPGELYAITPSNVPTSILDPHCSVLQRTMHHLCSKIVVYYRLNMLQMFQLVMLFACLVELWCSGPGSEVWTQYPIRKHDGIERTYIFLYLVQIHSMKMTKNWLKRETESSIVFIFPDGSCELWFCWYRLNLKNDKWNQIVIRLFG